MDDEGGLAVLCAEMMAGDARPKVSPATMKNRFIWMSSSLARLLQSKYLRHAPCYQTPVQRSLCGYSRAASAT